RAGRAAAARERHREGDLGGGPRGDRHRSPAGDGVDVLVVGAIATQTIHSHRRRCATRIEDEPTRRIQDDRSGSNVRGGVFIIHRARQGGVSATRGARRNCRAARRALHAVQIERGADYVAEPDGGGGDLFARAGVAAFDGGERRGAVAYARADIQVGGAQERAGTRGQIKIKIKIKRETDGRCVAVCVLRCYDRLGRQRRTGSRADRLRREHQLAGRGWADDDVARSRAGEAARGEVKRDRGGDVVGQIREGRDTVDGRGGYGPLQRAGASAARHRNDPAIIGGDQVARRVLDPN